MKFLILTGNARMSVGIYNTKDDIDYFVNSLNEVRKILNHD